MAGVISQNSRVLEKYTLYIPLVPHCTLVSITTFHQVDWHTSFKWINMILIVDIGISLRISLYKHEEVLSLRYIKTKERIISKTNYSCGSRKHKYRTCHLKVLCHILRILQMSSLRNQIVCYVNDRFRSLVIAELTVYGTVWAICATSCKPRNRGDCCVFYVTATSIHSFPIIFT